MGWAESRNCHAYNFLPKLDHGSESGLDVVMDGHTAAKVYDREPELHVDLDCDSL